MKRKLTRKDFAGLRQHYPVLSKEEMRQYVGGLNAEGYWENSDSLFTAVNPYATDFGVTPFSSSSYGYGDWDIDGGELPEVVIGGYYDGGYDAYEGYDIDGGELPEVEIGGSYPDDNENWNPEWDYYDPWPDDPDFDSTTGNDGYYDMGYWYEEYDGDNGNTGGSSGGSGGSSDNGGSSTNPLTDGIDISNSKHFTFKTESEKAFHEQLTRLLESNSVIKNLLSYPDKGYVHLTFDILDMEQNATALSGYESYVSYVIQFNKQCITEEGWNVPFNVTDNIGYDRNKIKTTEEALLVTLTHEAIHTRHWTVFNDAYKHENGNIEKVSSFLLSNGYSQEFVNIFIDEETKTRVTDDDLVKNMHQFIKDHDLNVIDKALEEYRNEFK